MLRGLEGQELPTSDEGRETIELSPDQAREAMNRHMEEVFGTEGNDIDEENPVHFVG